MSEWVQLQLGKMCLKIGSGATPRGGKDAYRGGETALIRSQNVYNDRFNREGLVYINESQAHELRNVVVEKTDVLLNITGDSVARCCQVDPNVLPARVNQHVAIIRTNAEILDSRFLKYVLISPSIQDHLLALASAGATRNALTKAMLETLEIKVPRIQEQYAIAHILGTLDEKIDLQRQQNETLEAMARALFKAWFVDFEPVRAKMVGRWQRGQSLPGLPAQLYDLFPDQLVESELGYIPEGWSVGLLEDMLVLQRGFDLPSQSRIEGPFPVIAAGGINGTHHKAMVKGPGVVTGRSGVLGNVFFELGDYWPLNTTLWVKEFRAAKPCYAYELLRCFDFKAFNTGSAVPTLNRNHIHVMPQIIPPTKVIVKFEELAMAFHRDIFTNKNESRSLANLRDILLPKLISGKLSIPDAKHILEEVSA